MRREPEDLEVKSANAKAELIRILSLRPAERTGKDVLGLIAAAR